MELRHTFLPTVSWCIVNVGRLATASDMKHHVSNRIVLSDIEFDRVAINEGALGIGVLMLAGGIVWFIIARIGAW